MSHKTNVPGPKNAWFGLKNALGFQKAPLDWVLNIAKDYPNIAHFKLGPQYDIYLITNPQYVHDILVDHYEKFKRFERQTHIVEKMTGPYFMMLLEGEAWKANRKLVAPAFHTGRIKNYINLMEAHTMKQMAHWADGEVRDLHHDMTETTMGIIGEILFDIDDIERDATELGQSLEVLMEMFILEATSLMAVPDWVPTPRNLRENHAMKYTHDYIADIIAQRRASGEDHGDVMSALLHAVDDDDGSSLTDEEVRDSLLGLFTAGHETTAILLTWALYMLAKHPDVQAKVYDELMQNVQGEAPTYDELQNMTYTRQVIKETLRLYPPAYALQFRTATQEVFVGEHNIPKGGIVMMSPYIVHHDPNYWEDPYTFDPSRFAENYRKDHHAYCYFPFGGGSRVCVAGHLAELEAVVILSTVVKHYQIALQSGMQEVGIKPILTLHPDGGLPLVVNKRTSVTT